MFDPELEALKQIDLRAYAADQGYTLDRKESCGSSAVMRNSNGDKIIIKRDVDGHFVFFSVRDDADHGSIIDFAKRRLGLSLGAVRKELRPWIGMPSSALPSYPALPKVVKDRLRVEREFMRMQDAPQHPYLLNERYIPREVLNSERFAGTIRMDARGNAVFPHFDADGLSGYEVKNRNFTSFASGGSKGLWLSNTGTPDNRMVFCEGAIDALSYACLFPDDQNRFASIGGRTNPLQQELIRAAASRVPAGSEIVAAMDADKAGRELAEVVRKAVELSGRADLRFRIHEPVGAKDWNDILKAKRKLSSSYRPEVPSVA
jgi:hypothetical protein